GLGVGVDLGGLGGLCRVGRTLGGLVGRDRRSLGDRCLGSGLLGDRRLGGSLDLVLDLLGGSLVGRLVGLLGLLARLARHGLGPGLAGGVLESLVEDLP